MQGSRSHKASSGFIRDLQKGKVSTFCAGTFEAIQYIEGVSVTHVHIAILEGGTLKYLSAACRIMRR